MRSNLTVTEWQNSMGMIEKIKNTRVLPSNVKITPEIVARCRQGGAIGWMPVNIEAAIRQLFKKGVSIEFMDVSCGFHWRQTKTPSWGFGVMYRLKPRQKITKDLTSH